MTASPPPLSPPDGPRAVTDADFPTDADRERQITFLINWSVLAPSVLNTQPWRFSREPGAVLLWADRERQLRALDPTGRELTISCGAALLNLRLAARHYGFVTALDRMPDPDWPDLLARLSIVGEAPATREEDALFGAIKRRRTHRRPFADLALPARLAESLRDAAEAEEAALHVLTPDQQARLADFVGAAILEQSARGPLLDEIRAWLRPPGDPRRDGVPDAEQGDWDRRAERRSDSETVADRARALAAGAPTLVAMTTAEDTPHAWLRAGEALQRVLLLAASHGLAVSYLNQPLEMAPLRDRVRALLSTGHPQVVLRIGYPIDTTGTPRRSVHDVLDGADIPSV